MTLKETERQISYYFDGLPSVAVRKALYSLLDDDYLDIVLSVYRDKKPLKAVADELGISVRTAQRHKVRLLEEIRERIRFYENSRIEKRFDWRYKAL